MSVRIQTHAAYPNGDPGIERLHLRADLQLRIDLAQLVACIDAPPPQTPFHFTSSEVHTMVTSADPYFVDVDLLATLTEGVTVPDETAEQRHGHIASKIGLLPLSVLVPRATGVEVVAPWSQAVSLSQGLARAKDIETAAMASDADIALAPLATTLGRSKERLRPTLGRQSSVPAPGSDDRVLAQDVATAAAAGIVVVTRHAEAFTDVLPTLYVRMRALGRAHVVGQDAGVPTPPRSLLLSVELESTLPSCAYIVHALDITLGEPLEADGAGSVASELITPVIEAVQRDAPTFPIRIEPRAQHNVLYSARLEELQGAPDALARALAQWSPRRKAHVSVRGTPARTETAGEASTCASQWNGTIDLSAVQIEQQRRLLATAAVLDATGYDGRHSAPLVEQPKPLVAGDAQYTASALAQHAVHEKAGPAPPPKDRKGSNTRAASVPSPLSTSYLDEAKRRAERPAPFAAAPAPRHSAERHAYAWGRDDLHAETLDGALRRSEERAPGAEDRTLLASIHVVPEHPTSEAMTSVPCCSTLTIHVELFNVAARPMEAILSWDSAEGDTSSLAPSALLVDVSEVHVGYVPRLTQSDGSRRDGQRDTRPVCRDARAPLARGAARPRRAYRPFVRLAQSRIGVCTDIATYAPKADPAHAARCRP